MSSKSYLTFRAFGCLLVLMEMVLAAPNPYEIKSPLRQLRPIKIIPIRTMDAASQRFVKVPALNPDAELIFSPSRSQRYQYEKIMERLVVPPASAAAAAPASESSSTATDANVTHDQQEQKRNKFNFLNFDAYLVRPMPVNYEQVFATARPEAEKLLNAMKEDIGQNQQNPLSPDQGYSIIFFHTY